MTAVVGLDETLGLAKKEEATPGDVLAAFLDATLLLPSTVEYDPRVPISPLFVKLPTGSYMVVFSHSDHIGPFQSTVKAVVTMSGIDIVKGIQDPEMGILLNPGTEVGYQIDGFVVSDLAKKIG